MAAPLHFRRAVADTSHVTPRDEFADVLAAAQRAEAWAVASLWRTYQPSLLRYLRGMCQDACEDVASEVWLECGGRMERFRGDEAAFRAWLFTNARRRAIDHHRRAARSAVPVAELPERPSAEEVGWERAEALEWALDRLRTLSPDQREVVLLRVVGGFDVDEVASLMGKQPGTVRVLHHRAVKALAAALGRERVTASGRRTFSEHGDGLAA
jgi:RNA polymerase sigma-70 factor, ECF subfamily